ncbi:hypothetical protein [Actinomadura sp. DC4]|uniref:hypothetical protein n=1 Tax=Actinomadura sp. DC4 TaxID=3055069 RepID=UPI0025AF9133|nr:hypothetical protein [Actinomadura sp. DC4]MDN3357792.1 hypothetical protein [Actinomadura sp. DC4]
MCHRIKNKAGNALVDIIEVKVGLLGDPFPELFEICSGPETDVSGTPTVTVEARSSETLAEIIDRALPSLGLTLNEQARDFFMKRDGALPSMAGLCEFIAIGQYGDAPPLRLGRMLVTDQNGLIESHAYFSDVTFEQLVDAVDLGLIRGDPKSLYLLPGPPGGGGLEAWETFLSTLNTICTAYSLPGAIQATNVLVAKAYQRVTRGRQIAEAEAVGLSARQVTPDDIRVLLGCNQWTTAQVMRFLGVTENHAVGFLELFGYRQEANGRWQRGGTPEADMAVADTRLALCNQAEFLDPDLLPNTEDELQDAIKSYIDKVIRERIDYLIEHNEAPAAPAIDEVLSANPWEPPQ